jgi:hypothetical protein
VKPSAINVLALEGVRETRDSEILFVSVVAERFIVALEEDDSLTSATGCGVGFE